MLRLKAYAQNQFDMYVDLNPAYIASVEPMPSLFQPACKVYMGDGRFYLLGETEQDVSILIGNWERHRK